MITTLSLLSTPGSQTSNSRGLFGASEIIRERENGSVIRDPANVFAVVEAIEYWRGKPSCRPVPVTIDVSLDRNVAETLAILEWAARERAGLR